MAVEPKSSRLLPDRNRRSFSQAAKVEEIGDSMTGKVQYPEKCSRGRCDCQPYALIESNTDPYETSFFCVGGNGGKMSPTVPTDIYTVCFKGRYRDEMAFFDERDLIHQQYVIAAALVHINIDKGGG